MMVLSVGDGAALAAAAAELAPGFATVERVRVLRRDGAAVGRARTTTGRRARARS